MIALTLAELAQALGGTLLLPDGVTDDTVVSGTVETDSRLVGAGSVFFALPGEETDGHLFAPAAVEAGRRPGRGRARRRRRRAAADRRRTASRRWPRWRVWSSRASAPPESSGSSRSPGSNGKTTTKNLLRAVLDAEGPTDRPAGLLQQPRRRADLDAPGRRATPSTSSSRWARATRARSPGWSRSRRPTSPSC